jgi:hypothetical protein
MIKENLFWSNKLGPFPFSPSPLKFLITYLDDRHVIVCESKKQDGGKVKEEDLDGRGVEVWKDGRMNIGHWKKGKKDGLMRSISQTGFE